MYVFREASVGHICSPAPSSGPISKAGCSRTQALLTDLPLAFIGSYTHFPRSVKFIGFCMNVLSWMYVAASVYPSIGDNTRCGRKWSGWGVEGMGIGKCRRERFRSFGEKLDFVSLLLCTFVCEVVRQNHLSHVSGVYFVQGQTNFIRGRKAPFQWNGFITTHWIKEIRFGS